MMTDSSRRSILKGTFHTILIVACLGLYGTNLLCAEDRPDPSAKVETAKAEAGDPVAAQSKTRQLFEKLQMQNAGNVLFTEPWLRTLKEIVELGPDAVPELIEELDAAQDDRSLRCLGFILRAIGDQRCVPALIRAIPRTLRPGSSDMGLRADDPDLLKFAQANDLHLMDRDNQYGFGRPVREICGALQKLTGKSHGEEDLFHVSLGGSPSQVQRKRALFQRVSVAWASWWERNWKEYVQDEAFSKVCLELKEDEGAILPPSPNSHFKTGGGSSNWILESVLNPQAKRVFYDLDVGRTSALPEKWRNAENIDAHLDDILIWAMREGFDLMGTEYETAEGRKIYTLRSIGLHAWELGKERWKMHSQDLTLEDLKSEGRPAEKLLLHYDVATESFEPLETASFLFVTRHGTPGLLFVGIEVQDDSLKPGGVAQGDNELNPIAFYKGRRFGFTSLEEINP